MMKIPNPKNDVASSLLDATQKLSAVSDTARLDAELLMAHALEMKRSEMLLRLPELAMPDSFPQLVERRLVHEPVAYILGVQHFWDLSLDVSPAVLIPRADSETLIEAAKAYFKDHKPTRILDLGTGSGALLLAALSVFPEATGIGVDASRAALSVATANAEKFGYDNRTQFFEASWRTTGWARELGTFDLILCNPPYVETSAELAPQVRDFEPASALYSGEDGLDDYHILIPQIPALLRSCGVALFELGKGQDEAVSNLAASCRLVSHPHKDLAGIVRALGMGHSARG